MKKLLFLALSGLMAFQANTQTFNRFGNPLVTNYTPEVYGGNEQVWCVTQDDRGVMYFGTNDNGILEYDGKTWNIIPIPENKSVRSLCKGDDGVIYVGSIGEFGYLEPDAYGNLNYTSLVNLVPDSIRSNLSYIYKTYWHDGKVYFCSLSYVFIYNGKAVKSISLGKQSEYANFLTLKANNRFYVNSYLKGLRTFINDSTLDFLPEGQAFIHKSVFSVVELNSNTILLFTDAGFYTYTNDKAKSVDTPTHLAKRMVNESAIPYSAIKLNDGNIAIGVVQSDWLGVVELTPDMKPIALASKRTGMHAGQVSEVFQNGDAPLWATLYDGGIAKVELNSAIGKFGHESGLSEIIVDIVRFNNTIYLATFNGVYYLTYDSNGVPKFNPVEGINGNVWALSVFSPPHSPQMLVAGSYTDGVFEIKGSKAINISNPLIERLGLSQQIQHKCFTLYPSENKPGRLYIGLASGVAFMDWVNGEWQNTGNLFRDSIRFEIRSIVEDSKGNLWLATGSSGVYMVTHDFKRVRLFGKESIQGLNNLQYINLLAHNDSLYILTANGVYHLNYQNSQFEPGGLVGSEFANRSGFFKAAKLPNGWAFLAYDSNNKSWIERIVKDSSGNWISQNRDFKRLPNKWADVLFSDPDGTLWIGMSKDLWVYNPAVKRSFNAPFRAVIRQVVSKDSLLFGGIFYTQLDSSGRKPSLVQQPYQMPRLSYHYNAMVFTFAAPYFEREEDIVYSHYLEGSDETTWSPWDKRTEATYTNLSEGKYTFHVKAKNIYGDESLEASYSFEIRPPWYRTIWAFILYFILAACLVWGIVKWNTRRLIAEKEHLEQIVRERTAEVVAQKEEIEQQKEKIAAQNEEITSSIQYASRIQSALLTPNDQINRIFPENFILYLPRDIVSGDFFYITQVGKLKISVVADCTGHGVPGGFMSMLGISFLTQIIGSKTDLKANEVLNELRTLVITALHQTGEIGGSKDGMDIAIYIIDEETQTLQFAGANNPLILIRNNELTHIKGDKMPIGIHLRGELSFTNNVMEIQKGDVIYTFSDGYVDQFGGDAGRKFMIKHFKELLLEIHHKPMNEQRQILEETLKNWHGNTPRIDDVVVMGVRIV
jgi:serine phosphatase RsbU (regulator of sigma subunit)